MRYFIGLLITFNIFSSELALELENETALVQEIFDSGKGEKIFNRMKFDTLRVRSRLKYEFEIPGVLQAEVYPEVELYFKKR